MKIRGVNSASRWGRIANQRKRLKIIRDFPSDLTCNFEMEIPVLCWLFLFLKLIFKIVERTFLHESDTFKVPLKKEGGELTFSRLGCQHLKSASAGCTHKGSKKKSRFRPGGVAIRKRASAGCTHKGSIFEPCLGLQWEQRFEAAKWDLNDHFSAWR